MLFTFHQGVAPRAFGFVFPPDWYDHVGEDLALLVCLHGGGTTVENFMGVVHIDDLLTGKMHPDQPKPKVVAIFPGGLTDSDQVEGNWDTGHIEAGAQFVAPDDVSFVFACIDRVDQWMCAELQRLRDVTVPSVFIPELRFIMGFSNGAALTAHVMAQRPGFFAAAAMHSHLFGGWKHNFMRDTLELPPERDEPNPTPGEQKTFAVRLIHLIGDIDDRVLPAPNMNPDDEGTTPEQRREMPQRIGPLGARPPRDYMRYDLSITDGLQAWANAMFEALGAPRARPGAWLVQGGRRHRTWDVGGEPVVVQVMIRGLDHRWWYPDDLRNATQHFWDFFRGVWP